MRSPVGFIRSFRVQYVVFIVTIVITVLFSQAIIHFDFQSHSNDKHLIDLAERQRGLSHHMAKLALYIQNDVQRHATVTTQRLDSLDRIVSEWRSVHDTLLADAARDRSTGQSSHAIDSTLQAISGPLSVIALACEQMADKPSPMIVNAAIGVISLHEGNMLMLMDRLVAAYQEKAEKELTKMRGLQIAVSIMTALILLLELFFIFRPIVRDLTDINRKYAEQNQELTDMNRELSATDERLRSNLQYVSELQGKLAASEKKFRELVEHASDMIYELDEKGKFSFVNPIMEQSIGFSADDLKKKVYTDLIHPDYVVKAKAFYKQQQRNLEEYSYFEMPVVSSSGATIWIGQNVRMFFQNGWVTKVGVVARNISEIKRMQKKLEESELLYRSISEQATDVIAISSPENIFSYVSPSSVAMLGYSPQELIGTHSSGLAHPDDQASILGQAKLPLNGRTSVKEVFRLRKKDSRYLWVEGVFSVITDEAGSVTAVQSLLRDITDRKLAEDALKVSEERFKLLADNAPIGIFQTDAQGGCIYVNNEWMRVTGMESKNAMGAGWLNVMHPDDKHWIFRKWLSSVESKSKFEAEFRFINRSMGTRDVRSNAIPVMNGQGLSGFIGTITDITELTSAQRKLVESEKLYRELSENSEDFTALIDTGYRYAYLSNSVEKLFGDGRDSIVGRDVKEFVHEEDASRLTSALLAAAEEKATKHAEYRVRQNDGGYIWLDTLLQPFFDEQGNLTSYQLSSRNITSRKKAEDDLNLAKERAEEATKAKSQFLSMMSHEIRTPMNAIIGLTNLLLKESPTEQQLNHLKLLEFSGENLLTIINDILDFSKIEAGKIVLEDIDFNLREVLVNLISLHRGRATEKGIPLQLQFLPGTPEIIKGDQVRITQILANLISNAIKFTDRGSVTVTISEVNSLESLHCLKFVVADDGIGMTPDQMKNLFESFSQASADTTRRFGGTGLGLAITKNLLALMGSDIQVASTPGRGSVFSFILKVKRGKISDTSEERQENLSNAMLSGAQVLIAEDNRVNQVVASGFLKQWGIESDFADNGSIAVKMIQSRKYHMVLMDLQMPEMDGYEASMEIRSLNDPYFKAIPIIALTADAMTEVRDRALRSGMTDLLIKPFKPENFRKLVSLHLQNFSKFKPVKKKSLLNFAEFSYGDPEFEKELARAVCDNLRELKVSMHEALKTRSRAPFDRALHKMKTSLSIITDTDFKEVIDDLKIRMPENGDITPTLQQKLCMFENMYERIVSQLKLIHSNGSADEISGIMK